MMRAGTVAKAAAVPRFTCGCGGGAAGEMPPRRAAAAGYALKAARASLSARKMW